MKFILAVLIIAFLLTGCHTMHIHNGPESAPARTADEWHTTIIFGLAEISDPVDLSNRCPNGWITVTNEKTFIQGFLSAITWSIYDPWNVKYSCKGKSQSSANAVEIPENLAKLPRNV